ncbi:Nramp family divalent metal transporter [Ruania alba]|uniref:NRAMP (Natural resistance-associated macrophage protein) metal ion transporters n=1 Tax=Ruania alba TaxID=648782 RepID=A0A1H5EQF1_9MICO|nr:Nramp family divalent metal transporter [Ruania alba]SED93355.1 NRAMP (natural resistance-associated macrophage protein) metal ion transporters [Ruania alba]
MTSSAPTTSRGRFTARLGPAFITAALMFGPGSIATTSSLGAQFAYDLVWVPVVATVLMLCFVDLCVRIGLSTDVGPVETIRRRFGRVVAILVGLGAFAVTASFQGSNSVGTGAAMSVLFDGSTTLFAALFTLLAVGFLWLPAFYRRLERVMVVIILAMLTIFLVTLVVSQPDLGGVLRGLVPGIPSGASALVVGAVATTFSVVGALYQIQLVREKGWTVADYRTARRDAITGILILGGLSFAIMIAAAAVLHPQGVTVSSPADMASILEPAIGGWAAALFALGLWAAAFSSLIGNSTIGGSMLAGALGIEQGGLSSRAVKMCITVVIVLGGIVAVTFGGLPLPLIVTAQAVTIFVVPLIGFVLVRLSRAPERGELRLPIPQLVLAIAGVVFLVLLAVTYIRNLL